MSGTTNATANKTSRAKSQPCKFFLSDSGCRAGSACPYKHDTAAASQTQETASKPKNHPKARQFQAPPVDTSRIVQRPKPKIEDDRTFQLEQIKRRFSPEHIQQDDMDVFKLSMSPSDPDFPYDLEALTCSLEVPKSYPKGGRPKLSVLNKEIPRGFAINIERGFTMIATDTTATLLGMLNRLDRQLEKILSGEMAETIKIVAHRPKQPATTSQPPSKQTATPAAILPSSSHTTPPHPQSPSYTTDQKLEAQKRRQVDTRQLEARFGRLPSFVKSNDGLRYTLPLESPKKSTWPAPLQTIKISTLIVPELYPLEVSSLVLDSDSPEARNIEAAFVQRGSVEPSSTLTQLINFLTINLKDMAQTIHSSTTSKDTTSTATMTTTVNADQVTAASNQETSHVRFVDDKPHIQIIPRPPEWDMAHDSDSEDSNDDAITPYDTGDDTEGTAASGDETQMTSTAPVERGILLSFPNLELHGIELMEVTSLAITIKCDRCKDTMDVERLRSMSDVTIAAPRSESCKKCANQLSIGFRADLIHSNSVRAGYLDLDGCTVVDMLLSSFIPTCAECSTPYPAPGVVCVRGESAMAICRECHKKMTFKIQEVKFLQVSAANIRALRAPGRKKPKEKLGIVAGTELPRRGRCTHYAKSYRWFRFSCCNKVFACDRCHDEAEEHPNEHANRMLCGYCSREQNYRPEDCGICHAVLIGRRGHGFWEGGKGTRDKARMSRKDPRKYKRVGGGAQAKRS